MDLRLLLGGVVAIGFIILMAFQGGRRVPPILAVVLGIGSLFLAVLMGRDFLVTDQGDSLVVAVLGGAFAIGLFAAALVGAWEDRGHS